VSYNNLSGDQFDSIQTFLENNKILVSLNIQSCNLSRTTIDMILQGL